MTVLGKTFEPTFDQSRLNRQMGRVFRLMSDGQWRTLREIADVTHDPEASVSARLRDFRREGFEVERRRRGDPSRGLHEYRLSGSMIPKIEFAENGQGAFL